MANIQKRLAAKITGKSVKKIRLDPARNDEIKEAITRADVRALLKDNAITVDKEKGISRSRAKKKTQQRIRGRQKGHGKRKGTQNARLPFKTKWMNKIRLQREFLKELLVREKILKETYKDLYKKAKGGFFRSKRHIKLYLTEHKLMK